MFVFELDPRNPPCRVFTHYTSSPCELVFFSLSLSFVRPLVIWTHAAGQFNISHHPSFCYQAASYDSCKFFSALICIWAADTDQLSAISPTCTCSSPTPTHILSYHLQRQRKCLFSCSPLWPLPCTEHLADWQLESLNPLLTSYCSGSEAGKQESTFTLAHIHSLLPASPPPPSTICLLPYKTSRSALKYWLVWSPVSLCCDVVQQQRRGFLF